MRIIKIAIFIIWSQFCYSGSPVWTINPDSMYPPDVSVTPITTAYIQYTVTNQSRKPHTLNMKPIPGITQITSDGNCSNPFTLSSQQSCTLTLFVAGNQLKNSVYGGPVICESMSSLECYQPSPLNLLNIRLLPISYYTITPSADTDGIISPNLPQTVIAGTNITFTATPDVDYQVDEWTVNGLEAQKGGSTFTLNNIQSDQTVNVSFTRKGTIFAGTAEGSIYYSNDNGLHWYQTNTPSSGYAVNGLFANQTSLYAGSSDGYVYYSTNNGNSWNHTSTVDGSAINGIFVNPDSTLYVGTNNGRVFYSYDNGNTWLPTTSQPGTGAINSLYILNSSIYIGSEDGNIYYSNDNGALWNTISGPEADVPVPVQNVFAVNGQIYANTHQITNNNTLPPNTINFEYAYVANTLTATSPSWSLFSQITYTLFVNADASALYAGTQNGHVFSLTTGNDLGFLSYTPITSLFFIS